MDVNFLLLLSVCWCLIVVVFAGTDLEVKVAPNAGLDPKTPSILNNKTNLSERHGGLESVVDSKKVDQIKNGKDQAGGSEEGLQNTNSSEQKQVGLKEDHSEVKDKEGFVGKDDKNGKLTEGGESKEGTKEVPVTLPPVRKEGSRGEECDASNSCEDDKNALVACLRVPGNDSPDLSLLIQNKGSRPLSVTVSAPDFVQLEKTTIQLHEKENKKVKVSIREGGTDSLIVLTAGNGNCSLDFRDLTSHNFRKETDYKRTSKYISLVKHPPFVAFIVFAVLLVITASACTFVSFKRSHFFGNASKYQKLDMELPVSGGAKVEPSLNNGWDDNWDDNWDDEEAPKTPSMPVTPGLSSKGLASRRLNKDAWKD